MAAARFLRADKPDKSRSQLYFIDAPEFELVGTDGSELETDLLALVDRQLVVSEAKIATTFGTGKKMRSAAGKRVRAARVFVAEEIVLATTGESWDSGTVRAVESAIASKPWPSGHAPRLRTISRLGTPEVVDSSPSR